MSSCLLSKLSHAETAVTPLQCIIYNSQLQGEHPSSFFVSSCQCMLVPHDYMARPGRGWVSIIPNDYVSIFVGQSSQNIPYKSDHKSSPQFPHVQSFSHNHPLFMICSLMLLLMSLCLSSPKSSQVPTPAKTTTTKFFSAFCTVRSGKHTQLIHPLIRIFDSFISLPEGNRLPKIRVDDGTPVDN